jgi:hypothetical protein
MFDAAEVTVEAGIDDAAARLRHLISRGALHAPSEDAYEEGLATLLRVGPFGGARGLSKLVRVRLLEPIARGDTLSFPLRWEATGAAGELFPVLDADLVLAPEGPGRVRLGLAGSYRPPFGKAGQVLDRAIMHRLAMATLQSLLGGIAEALADPSVEPLTNPQIVSAPRWRPVSEPFEA